MHIKPKIKSCLLITLSAMRRLIWIAVGINIAIETAEVYLQKDTHHLAASAIFFLLANLQLGFGRFMLKMREEETAKLFMYISIFMICAAIIEVIDLGLDMALVKLNDSNYTQLFYLTSIIEFLLGTISTILAGYSMDQFFVLIRTKVIVMLDTKEMLIKPDINKNDTA